MKKLSQGMYCRRCVKPNPGSRVEGIMITEGDRVIFGAELNHRGQAIKASLASRRAIRRDCQT